MGWSNLVSLGLGLAVGAGVGWLIGKGRADATQRNDSSSAPIDPSPAPSYPTSPEIQTLNQQLQQTQLAYQMSREMAQFQAGFLARTSHELRSPINSVISLHQLILADLAEDPAEEREFIAQANQSAQKMLALLDQLIGVSKAAYGSTGLQLQALSLWEALAEVEQFTQLPAKNRNLRLNIELPEPDILVWADRNWLRQVLLNLIDGPIALMQEGHIHVTTQSAPEIQQVHIRIMDQRPAHFWYDPIDLLTVIKNSTLEEFSKDVLLQEQSSAPSPGLSLLVAQTLVELMGGHLEILSTPAQDTADPETRIQCSLPLAKQ